MRKKIRFLGKMYVLNERFFGNLMFVLLLAITLLTGLGYDPMIM